MMNMTRAAALAAAMGLLVLLPARAGHAASADDALFAHSVMDSELAATRGTGAPDVFNLSNLTATLSNNTAIGSVSGNNSIATGALNGISGISSVIQNSGNNVVIQNSTIVNVTFDNSAPVIIH